MGNTYVGTKAKLYGGLAFIKDSLELIEEVEIEDPILLGDEEASFLDSRCAKMTLGENVGIVDDVSKAAEGVIGFKVGEASYRFSYVPSGQVASEALAAKLAGVGIGTKITKLDGVWGGSVKETDCSDLIAVGDANDIEIAYADPTEVTISGPTEVQAGSSIVLSAEVAPSGANQEVVWSVDDETKAHFDGNTLYADVEGTVVVSATAVDDDTVVGTYNITITEAPSVNVESITVSAPTDVTGAAIGETVQMSAEVLPSNALQGVNWISSNEDVATVDENGLVTFLADGSVEITASAKDESGVVSSAVTLTTVINNLKTHAELVALTASLNNNVPTADVVAFRGRIISTQGSNAIVSDGVDGVETYGIALGELKVGDPVVIIGKVVKYYSLVEFRNADGVKVYKSYAEIAEAPEYAETTAEEFNTVAASSGSVCAKRMELKNVYIDKNSNGYASIAKIGGTAVKSSLYAASGVETPEIGLFGTAKVTVLSTNSSNKTLTVWLDEWTDNTLATGDAVTLEADSTELSIGGDAAHLNWKVTSSTAGQFDNIPQDVEWVVSDETVISVNEAGEVNGLKEGSATVKAKIPGTEIESAAVTFTVAGAATSKTVTYTIANFEAGVQYAEGEEHVLDANTTITTTQCHFTSEIRMYSSETHDAFFILESQKVITNVSFNAGNNADTFVIDGSADGETYTNVAEQAVVKTYADYSIDIAETLGYKFLKFDVKGTAQLRIKSITITYSLL